MSPATRTYQQTARARSVARTRERILEAAAGLLRDEPPARVGLPAIATAAGATVPTVLRHFAGKDAVLAAALRRALASVIADRAAPSPGNALEAASILAAEYRLHEPWLRAAEQFGGIAVEDPGRAHREWTARAFSPTLGPLLPVVHRRRLAQLATLGAAPTWWALREREGLPDRQAVAALAELLAVSAGGRGPAGARASAR